MPVVLFEIVLCLIIGRVELHVIPVVACEILQYSTLPLEPELKTIPPHEPLAPILSNVILWSLAQLALSTPSTLREALAASIKLVPDSIVNVIPLFTVTSPAIILAPDQVVDTFIVLSTSRIPREE